MNGLKTITIALVLMLAGCEEAETWDCACKPVCDGISLDEIKADNICGPPDAAEAVGEAADGCIEGLQEAGCYEAACACTCESQGPC